MYIYIYITSNMTFVSSHFCFSLSKPFPSLLSASPILCHLLRPYPIDSFGGDWIMAGFSSFFLDYALFLFFIFCLRIMVRFFQRLKTQRQVLPPIFLGLVFVLLFRATFLPGFDLGPSTGFYISRRQFLDMLIRQ